MIPGEVVSALVCGVPLALSGAICPGFDFLRRVRNAAHVATDAEDATRVDSEEALHLVVARLPQHFTAADDLVRRRYAWRGYNFVPEDVRQERSTQEITFLVASEFSALGTLTLGLDGPLGLLAELGYGDVIAEFRAEGYRVCELTRLALAESIDSKTVLAALFCLAHAVGRTLHEVTHVFIEVNPRHVDFYCKVLGFAVAAGERLCERVRARSVLLKLEIEALEERLGLLDPEYSPPPLAEAA